MEKRREFFKKKMLCFRIGRSPNCSPNFILAAIRIKPSTFYLFFEPITQLVIFPPEKNFLKKEKKKTPSPKKKTELFCWFFLPLKNIFIFGGEVGKF